MAKKSLKRRVRRCIHEWSKPVRRLFQPPRYLKELARIDRLEHTVGHLLARRYPKLRPPLSQRERLRASELKIFSQNGEDGILLELFEEVGVATGTLIEFGIQDGRECNGANLILHLGWGGLLMDGDRECIDAAQRYYYGERAVSPHRLALSHRWITADNIDGIIADAGLRGEIDLLSIDVDGNDFWVWKAIRGVIPRVVVIEYNASFGPTESYSLPYDPGFARSDTDLRRPGAWYHGASLTALAELGSRKGYALVGCDSSGANAFFVRSDLLGIGLSPMHPSDAYYPDVRRLRVASVEQQLEELKRHPLVKDPDPTL